jgi:signal transduction histidine kinase
MSDTKLSIALRELAFQYEEKEKRAGELVDANIELTFQNAEKEKRAAELVLANKELTFQNEEKEKRAAELVIANYELAFQNEEKEKRAAELILANKELILQNNEKVKLAEDLFTANKKLAFENTEKEKRAAELVLANTELAFQNYEKEKRAAELIAAYKELELFNYISSHDLQEPLRKIQVFTSRIMMEELPNLSDKGKEYLNRMQDVALYMQTLIIDLLAYSRTNSDERKEENINLNKIILEVKNDLKDVIETKHVFIETNDLCEAAVIPYQFRQLMHHLIDNSIKFSNPEVTPHIKIQNRKIKFNEAVNASLSPKYEYCHICISDNGIGFDPQYKEHIFEIFKRLHHSDKIPGTGIGLAIVKKIVDNHNGVITATSEINKGSSFDIYIPLGEK